MTLTPSVQGKRDEGTKVDVAKAKADAKVCVSHCTLLPMSTGQAFSFFFLLARLHKGLVRSYDSNDHVEDCQCGPMSTRRSWKLVQQYNQAQLLTDAIHECIYALHFK